MAPDAKAGRRVSTEVVPNETRVKTAPVVTATELLGIPTGNRPIGVTLADAPIHSFLLDTPGKPPQIFAVLDRRLDGDDFFDLLCSVSPFMGGGGDRSDLIEHYKQIDPLEVTKYKAWLRPFHAQLGPDWDVFLEHAPLLGETLLQPPNSTVASIISNGTSSLDNFRLRQIEIAGDVWATSRPIHISQFVGDKGIPTQATTFLRRAYGQIYHNDGFIPVHIPRFRKDDKRTIPLHANMPTEFEVVIQVGNTLRAAIPTNHFTDENKLSLRYTKRWGNVKDALGLCDIQSSNVLVPTFNFTATETENQFAVGLDLPPTEDALVGNFVSQYVLPPELYFDHRRFNPIVGLLTALNFSGDIRDDRTIFPEVQPIGDSGPFMMAPPQLPLLGLQRKGEIAQASFVSALSHHTIKNAA